MLQDWKTERYKEIIKSGSVSSDFYEFEFSTIIMDFFLRETKSLCFSAFQVEPRPGVIRLMDEAKAAVIRSSFKLCKCPNWFFYSSL